MTERDDQLEEQAEARAEVKVAKWSPNKKIKCKLG